MIIWDGEHKFVSARDWITVDETVEVHRDYDLPTIASDFCEVYHGIPGAKIVRMVCRCYSIWDMPADMDEVREEVHMCLMAYRMAEVGA